MEGKCNESVNNEFKINESNSLQFDSIMEPTYESVSVTWANVLHWKRIYLQENESFVFDCNVKVFRNNLF